MLNVYSFPVFFYPPGYRILFHSRSQLGMALTATVTIAGLISLFTVLRSMVKPVSTYAANSEMFVNIKKTV